jgi:hypothetical protein
VAKTAESEAKIGFQVAPAELVAGDLRISGTRRCERSGETGRVRACGEPVHERACLLRDARRADGKALRPARVVCRAASPCILWLGAFDVENPE